MKEKMVIYQVFTRLFGNDCRTCEPWGDRVTNGCGLMNDFTPRALQQIKALGATHIWYTGIIEHTTQTDYSAYGVEGDHPGVVKGIAGSAYAIRDYYDVDPDLATSCLARMEEFDALVRRTHEADLKFILDFVPNHVARRYKSDNAPEGVTDLGAEDNQGMGFDPSNNFYYCPGEELHADFDLRGYHEWPAKATGNDNFSSWAHQNDWYETVKLNYGVDYVGGRVCHFDPIPSTWHKMLNILLYWAAKGIDGFRCDMAEMVPVEFWHWAIAKVKEAFPNIIFIAEVYNPAEYRNYIHTGGFDYLYDKVGLYDTLRSVICGYSCASSITQCWQNVGDIQEHMLNFLENHDEQRLASDFFAGDAEKGRAALLVSACMGTNPMMIYFGQELGERGMDAEGFSGRDGRTTIFDYWTVDTIRRWRNEGKFDNRQLTPKEVTLQQFYSRVLTLCNEEKAIREGEFFDLAYVNPRSEIFNPATQYAFIRRSGNEILLIIANFDKYDAQIGVKIPEHLFEYFNIEKEDRLKATSLLSGDDFVVPFNDQDPINMLVPGCSGRILKFTCKSKEGK
ncbi:MAG: alpha-amylase family protein [Bacteroidaceae bacterium]|nr:alpha-amylase family protein [Bacteroidaceae bacterium]